MESLCALNGNHLSKLENSVKKENVTGARERDVALKFVGFFQLESLKLKKALKLMSMSFLI